MTAAQAFVTTGIVAFSNLTEFDVYNGQSTGRYNLVITMDEAEAGKLSDMGVKLKNYEGKSQRKFATKFKVEAIDLEGNPVHGELPYGTEVRVLWAAGDADPQNGVPTFLNKVRVVQLAESIGDGEVPDEF